jgi:hypothetical protein
MAKKTGRIISFAEFRLRKLHCHEDAYKMRLKASDFDIWSAVAAAVCIG